MTGIDLHIHTTASDGRYTPDVIVARAAALGLKVIAICDHDTVNGIPAALEAARAFPELKVIPGVEISTDVPHGEVHILGYFIDFTDPRLQEKLEEMRGSRELRAQRMIAKLSGLGVRIEWHRVREIAGAGAIGRPHVAQAMLEKGYISSPREAFDRYIGRDGPAYVEREKMTPAESVQLVLKANGLPVLAHPLTFPDPEDLIIELKAEGLVGIEAYYAGYDGERARGLVELAHKHGMIPTGGSDFHGLDEAYEMGMGSTDVPAESVERLIALAKQRELKLAGL